MKKQLIKITCSLLFVFALSGCEETLEENPKTFVSPEALFTTAESYNLGVVGIYRTLPGTFSSDSWLTRETFSDIIGTVSGAYEQALAIYQNNHQPFHAAVRVQWGNNYAIVKDANFMLKKLNEATLVSGAQKNALIAESRFLRAYAFFQLVQLFGDVPMPTAPLEDFSNVQMPRTPQADVYKLIIEDLTFAETNLPDAAPVVGRVYKLVATALLSKVYLTMAGNPLKLTQYYADAKAKALAVINSGKFTLKDDYSQVFHNKVYTSESIWEQTYQSGTGGSNPLHVPSATAPGYAYILTPATWFISSFPAGDQRKAWGIKENYAAPSGTLAPFFHKFVDLTLINNAILPSAARVEYTVPILRLGEMYLIAAEAENEINGPANAYQYINKIRWRARVDKTNPAHVPDLAGLSKDQFRDAVLMERKWELHLEGSSWFDLKRTNTLGRIQTIRGNVVRPIGAYNNTWYIPDGETRNNNIPQNPAYQ